MPARARPYVRAIHDMAIHDIRYWRCRALEIEWVANVLSNILDAQGLPPIGMMTARGGMLHQMATDMNKVTFLPA
jgi:hypothetical protein